MTRDFSICCRKASVSRSNFCSRFVAISKVDVWVKRPGTGEIKARDYERVLGGTATRAIPANAQVKWSDVSQR